MTGVQWNVLLTVVTATLVVGCNANRGFRAIEKDGAKTFADSDNRSFFERQKIERQRDQLIQKYLDRLPLSASQREGAELVAENAFSGEVGELVMGLSVNVLSQENDSYQVNLRAVLAQADDVKEVDLLAVVSGDESVAPGGSPYKALKSVKSDENESENSAVKFSVSCDGFCTELSILAEAVSAEGEEIKAIYRFSLDESNEAGNTELIKATLGEVSNVLTYTQALVEIQETYQKQQGRISDEQLEQIARKEGVETEEEAEAEMDQAPIEEQVIRDREGTPPGKEEMFVL